MKYVIFLVLLFMPVCSFAGCDEITQSIANLDKAIVEQTKIIAGLAADTSGDAVRERAKASQAIEDMMKLKQSLSTQECLKNAPKTKPPESPSVVTPPAVNPKPADQKRFQPANKMY
jgi:hypothetical protein